MSQRDTFDRLLAALYEAMLDEACGTQGNALFITTNAPPLPPPDPGPGGGSGSGSSRGD